jgi:hypothetical protein
MTEIDVEPSSQGVGPRGGRVQRILQLVYAVEGVVAVRVWQWASNVAIGIRGGAAGADLIGRVEAAVAGLREPGETWHFGLLEEPSTGAPTLRAKGDGAEADEALVPVNSERK